jgi:hypothetical protein
VLKAFLTTRKLLATSVSTLAAGNQALISSKTNCLLSLFKVRGSFRARGSRPFFTSCLFFALRLPAYKRQLRSLERLIYHALQARNLLPLHLSRSPSSFQSPLVSLLSMAPHTSSTDKIPSADAKVRDLLLAGTTDPS